ncbi:MAG: oxidoreductase [Rhodococcus sp.]|nr:oxidoreductase [Rhodococcus sp. (in: high G+C Gram-positive bacteria)]
MTDELSPLAKVDALAAELETLDARRVAIGVELVNLQIGLDGNAKIRATEVFHSDYLGRLFTLVDELRTDE